MEEKYSFDAWLNNKRNQIEKEKEFKKKIEQINLQSTQTVSPEERSKVFKE